MTHPDPAQTFLLEAEDLLIQIEETTIHLEQHPDDLEAINRLFRSFHTLKGSGAMFGYDKVAGFTHHVESALDQVRTGHLPVTSDLLSLVLDARDQIKVLLVNPADTSTASATEWIVAALRELQAAQVHPEPTVDVPQAAATEARPTTWHIRFRPGPLVTTRGLDPAALLDDLRSLGECTIRCDTASVPALHAIHPEHAYLAWDIVLVSLCQRSAIRDVFMFVEDESELTIEEQPASAAAAPTQGQPATAVTLCTGPVAPPKDAPHAPVKAAAATPDKPAGQLSDTTVRVAAEKLDRLVSLVGELVMNQSRLAEASHRIDIPELTLPVEAIERLVAELRDSVLGIRMMPIGSTFARFKRLVRDLSLELGKEVDLVLEGAETELDKTILDQLGEPFVHLIRNCMDHGIESPEERLAAGKPARGTVRLAASHEGSHVVVSVEDDGRGIDPKRILAKAIERQCVEAGAALTEREILNLVFLPGFSTAEAVTSVSGRGVGLDAVKRQIEALRGSVELLSHPGAGTTFRLSLPLTLAIIEGLLVEMEGDRFIIPMSYVMENVELHRDERTRQNGRNLVAVRGELVPYVRLRELLDIPGEGPVIEKIVIARHEGQRVGLVVDRVIGTHQTVIQSLGRFYRNVKVCSGATIMGDGRVALIFSIEALVQHATACNAQTAP